MTWRYRVVREHGHYSLREVYASGYWSSDPRGPFGNDLNGLAKDLTRMVQALDLPVLEVKDGRLVQVSE